MAQTRNYDTMMSPGVEQLMSKTHSKFGLCTLAATRAREINAYFGQLGDGLGTKVPPQVTSVAIVQINDYGEFAVNSWVTAAGPAPM